MNRFNRTRPRQSSAGRHFILAPALAGCVSAEHYRRLAGFPIKSGIAAFNFIRKSSPILNFTFSYRPAAVAG